MEGWAWKNCEKIKQIKVGGLLSAPAEVPAFGKTIIDYSKNCHGAWDFKRLAEEIANKKEQMWILAN